MSYLFQSIDGNNEMDSVNVFWDILLQEAKKLGWDPKGTMLDSKSLDGEASPEDIASWEGHYDSNDGQLVTDEDTRALVEVIKKHKLELEKNPNIQEIDDEFIEFLEKGSFRIL